MRTQSTDKAASHHLSRCYGCIPQEDIVDVRAKIWFKKTAMSVHASPKLESLPPTEEALHPNILKDQYGPRVFFLEFLFFAENMIIRSILNLWWHSEILKVILGIVRGIFTKRLKGTRRLLYTVKSDFFEMTALHSKC